MAKMKTYGTLVDGKEIRVTAITGTRALSEFINLGIIVSRQEVYLIQPEIPLRKYGIRVGYYEITIEAKSKREAMYRFREKGVLLCKPYELPNEHGIPMRPTTRPKK